LKKALNKRKTVNEFKGERKTYIPIIYTTYGILNDFIKWKDIPFIENPLVFDSLKSIAIINISKLPGKKTSVPSFISKAYKDNRDILLKQINDFNPDIIIGGGTLDYFLKDLGLEKNMRIFRDIEKGSFPYYTKGKQIFISAYHPSSARVVLEEKYCNDIIETVRLWIEEMKF